MAKTGVHLAGSGRGGYGSFCDSIPAVIFSVGDGGGLQEAKAKSNGQTYTIYRNVSVYTEAPEGINSTDVAGAVQLANQYYPLLKAQWTAPNNAADYYTITNEQGGNDFDSYQRIIAYEKRIIELGAADGLKFCMLNLAGGSPGDNEAPGLWDSLCAPYIAWGWARGCIYGRHEYGSNSVMVPFDGNTGRAIRELEYLNSLGYYGGIVITELGVNGGYGFIGKEAWVKTRTDYDREIVKHRDIIGACDWNAGNNEFNANMSDAFPGLIAYNIANPTDKWEPVDTTPPPTQPPIDPPIPPPDHVPVIPNNGFNNGWTDEIIGGRMQQVPNDGYSLKVIEVPNKNFLDAEVTSVSEITHKLQSQLPEDEWLGGENALILDGDTTFKILQSSGHAVDVEVLQTIPNLLPDSTYRITIPVQIHYHGPVDVYDKDPPLEMNDIGVRITANYSVLAMLWPDLPDSEWVYPVIEGRTVANETEIRVSLRVCTSWKNKRSGFTDAWQIELVETENPIEPPDPPPDECVGLPREQYKRVVHVLPSTMSEADEIEVFKQARADGRQTVGWSYDDAGIGDLDNKTAILWEIPTNRHVEFMDWYAAHYPNTDVKFFYSTGGPGNPLDGLELGYLFKFKYRLNSAFNAPRDYNGDGNYTDLHEGADFDIVGGDPGDDNKVDVLCLFDGTIERSLDSTGNYGKYVRVVHTNNGSPFYTRYCHLDMRYVEVGQSVAMGTPLGEVGTSGLVTGEHIHLNLEVPNYGLDGYVVADVVDPVPYVKNGSSLPQYEAPTNPDYIGPHVSFISGVDQPASASYWPTAKAVFDITGLHPKFHASGDSQDWYLEYKHPTFNIARAYVRDNFVGTAQQFFDETIDAMRRFYNLGLRDFEGLNEPNHQHQGAWANGYEFGQLFQELCGLWLTALPGARIWYPGCSPQFGGQHAFIDDSRRGGAFNRVYGMAEHVYTGIVNDENGAMLQMKNEVLDFQRRHSLSMPLCVSEFSVNRPASGEYKAAVYHKFYDALIDIPGIQAAYSFTASWHPSPDVNKEGWLEHGIVEAF